MKTRRIILFILAALFVVLREKVSAAPPRYPTKADSVDLIIAAKTAANKGDLEGAYQQVLLIEEEEADNPTPSLRDMGLQEVIKIICATRDPHSVSKFLSAIKSQKSRDELLPTLAEAFARIGEPEQYMYALSNPRLPWRIQNRVRDALAYGLAKYGDVKRAKEFALGHRSLYDRAVTMARVGKGLKIAGKQKDTERAYELAKSLAMKIREPSVRSFALKDIEALMP